MISVALFILTLSVTNNHAARILAVFPVPSISHQVVFRPLTQELARRGHEVTVITPDPVFPKGEAPANLTEIDVHFTYEEWEKLYKITSAADSDLIKQMRGAFSMIVDVFEIQMKVDEVQKLLKEKFDLILVEACARPAIAPLIQVSSFGPMNFNVETVGSAWHPLLYPVNLSKRLYNLTMWEKVLELWNFYKLENVMREVEYEENKMTRRLFGPNVPTINELQNNVDMLFLNVHPVWEGNRPVPPSVIYMGGMHQKPVKELPEDLKNYLDSSKNGVIYISFGTNVKPSLLPPDRMKILLNVLSQQPYDVLWKWDKDELPGRTCNIRISKWLPQSDLLRHPKVKLFVMQGGLQSTDEAITAGVPLIGIPMLGDQWFNVEKFVYHKIGVKLVFSTLTLDKFKDAINTVIGDESYRQNIIKLGGLMRDQPMQPLNRAVWWTEYVLRHGGARHLRSPAANMSWTQFLELELVLTVVTIALSSLLLLVVLMYYLWKQFTPTPKHKKIKKQ